MKRVKLKWTVLATWMALSIAAIWGGSYGALGVLEDPQPIAWLMLVAALIGIVSFFIAFFQVFFVLEDQRKVSQREVASQRARTGDLL